MILWMKTDHEPQQGREPNYGYECTPYRAVVSSELNRFIHPRDRLWDTFWSNLAPCKGISHQKGFNISWLPVHFYSVLLLTRHIISSTSVYCWIAHSLARLCHFLLCYSSFTPHLTINVNLVHTTRKKYLSIEELWDLLSLFRSIGAVCALSDRGWNLSLPYIFEY
jgi:hypothetical protein